MEKITDHLYISGWNPSIDKKELIKNNIHYIIGITIQPKSYEHLNLYKKLNIGYIHIYEFDFPVTNLYKYFPTTSKFVYNCISQNKNVLIHCMAGMSRSATIIIAYLMTIYCMKLRSIYIETIPYSILPNILEFVKSRRKIARPNIGFIKQLKKYEQNLYNIF